MEQLARYRCLADDGSPLVVIEYRHVHTGRGKAGVSRHPGARRLALTTGEPVRYVDAQTFELIDSGALIRRRA